MIDLIERDCYLANNRAIITFTFLKLRLRWYFGRRVGIGGFRLGHHPAPSNVSSWSPASRARSRRSSCSSQFCST